MPNKLMPFTPNERGERENKKKERKGKSAGYSTPGERGAEAWFSAALRRVPPVPTKLDFQNGAL